MQRRMARRLVDAPVGAVRWPWPALAWRGRPIWARDCSVGAFLCRGASSPWLARWS